MALSIFPRCFVLLCLLSLVRAYTYVPPGTWEVKAAPAGVPAPTAPTEPSRRAPTAPTEPSRQGFFSFSFWPAATSTPPLEGPSGTCEGKGHPSVSIASAPVASSKGPVSSAAPVKSEPSRSAAISTPSSEGPSGTSGGEGHPGVSIALAPVASTKGPVSSAATVEFKPSRQGFFSFSFWPAALSTPPSEGLSGTSEGKGHPGVSIALAPVASTKGPVSSAAAVKSEPSRQGFFSFSFWPAALSTPPSEGPSGASEGKEHPGVSIALAPVASSKGPVSSAAQVESKPEDKGVLRRPFAHQGDVEGDAPPPSHVSSVKAPTPSPLRLAYEDFRRLFSPLPLIVSVDRTVDACLSPPKAPPPPSPPTSHPPPAPSRGHLRGGIVTTPAVKSESSGGASVGMQEGPSSIADRLFFGYDGEVLYVSDGERGEGDGPYEWPTFTIPYWLMPGLQALVLLAFLFCMLDQEANTWARDVAGVAWPRCKDCSTTTSAYVGIHLDRRGGQRGTAVCMPEAPPPGQLRLCASPPSAWATLTAWLYALLTCLRGLPAFSARLCASLRDGVRIVRRVGVWPLYETMCDPRGRRNIMSAIKSTLFPRPPPPKTWYSDAPVRTLAMQKRHLHERKLSEVVVGGFFPDFFDARLASLLLSNLLAINTFWRSLETSMLLPINAPDGSTIGFVFINLTPSCSHVAIWLLDATHSILSERLGVMRLALAYKASPLAIRRKGLQRWKEGGSDYVRAAREELQRGQRILAALRKRTHTASSSEQVLLGVEVLCAPPVPSRRLNPRNLRRIDEAFDRLHQAVLLILDILHTPTVEGLELDPSVPFRTYTRPSRAQ